MAQTVANGSSSSAPATLPADFNGWDKPKAAPAAARPQEAPATLPANFAGWDKPVAAKAPPVAAPSSTASTPQGADAARAMAPLVAHKNLNFVQRMFHPESYPVIHNADGTFSTHQMASEDNLAFPTDVYNPSTKKLEHLTPQAAYRYAIKTGEFIKFPTAAEANWWADNGYKKAFPPGYFDRIHGNNAAPTAAEPRVAADNALSHNGAPATFEPMHAATIANNDRWYDPLRREAETAYDYVGKKLDAAETKYGNAAGEILWNTLNPDSPFARPTPETPKEKRDFVATYGTTTQKKAQAEQYIKHLDATRAANVALTKAGVGAVESMAGFLAGGAVASAVLPAELHQAIQAGVDLGFTATMLTDAVKSVPQAVKLGKKYGYDSPQFSSFAVASGVNAIFATLGAAHLLTASPAELSDMRREPQTKSLLKAADSEAQAQFNKPLRALDRGQRMQVVNRAARELLNAQSDHANIHQAPTPAAVADAGEKSTTRQAPPELAGLAGRKAQPPPMIEPEKRAAPAPPVAAVAAPEAPPPSETPVVDPARRGQITDRFLKTLRPDDQKIVADWLQLDTSNGWPKIAGKKLSQALAEFEETGKLRRKPEFGPHKTRDIRRILEQYQDALQGRAPAPQPPPEPEAAAASAAPPPPASVPQPEIAVRPEAETPAAPEEQSLTEKEPAETKAEPAETKAAPAAENRPAADTIGPIESRQTSPERTPGIRTAPVKPMSVGKPVTIIARDGERLPAHYAVVGVNDLRPSHSPTTFQWFADYPEAAQPRERGLDMGAVSRVESIGAFPDASQLFGVDPTAQVGPPVILPDGVVIAGNGRAMGMALAYRNGKGDVIGNGFKEAGDRFGDNVPTDAESKPVPVIILDNDVTDPGELRRLGKELNEGAAGGMSSAEEGAAAASFITDKHIDEIADTMAQMGKSSDPTKPDTAVTLRQYMERHSADVAKFLMRSGMVSARRATEFVDPRTDRLTEKGKDLFESALRGKAIGSPRDVMEAQTWIPGTLNRLDRSLGIISQIRARGGEWDFTPYLAEALRYLVAAKQDFDQVSKSGKATDSLVDRYLHPGDYVGGNRPLPGTEIQRPLLAVILARTLEKPSPEIRDAMAKYAEEMRLAGDPNQSDFGFGIEKPDPVTAFNEKVAPSSDLPGRPNLRITADDWPAKDGSLAANAPQLVPANIERAEAIRAAVAPVPAPATTVGDEVKPAVRRRKASPPPTAEEVVAQRRGKTKAPPVATREAAAETAVPAKPAARVRRRDTEAYKKARAILRASMNQLNAGIPPEVFMALARITYDDMIDGAVEFKEWSKVVVADFGEAIRPHLAAAWNTAKAWIDVGYDPAVFDEVENEKETPNAKTDVGVGRTEGADGGNRGRRRTAPPGTDTGGRNEPSLAAHNPEPNLARGPAGGRKPRVVRVKETEALEHGGRAEPRVIHVERAKPRAAAVVSDEQWKARLASARLPLGMPAPTVRLSPEVAAKLTFPGQTELAEAAISSLDQNGGFLLASTTGSGKSYLAAAVTREALNADPNLSVLVITKNRGLIEQEERGLVDVFDGFGIKMDDLDPAKPNAPGVHATTYSMLARHPEIADQAYGLVIADESANARKWWESAQGALTKKLSAGAGKALYMSATPYHTPLELGYMDRLGLWPEGGFEQWVAQFGVRNKNGQWFGTVSPRLMAAFRAQMIQRGVFANMDLDMGGFGAHFGIVPLSESDHATLGNIHKAFADTERWFRSRGSQLQANHVRGLAVNFTKAWLERARLPQTIEHVKNLRAKGWQVVIFSETKAGRSDLYKPLEQADSALGGTIRALMPPLPDMVEELHKAFGDELADVSGPYTAKRKAELESFLAGKKQIAVGTYASIGEGAGLHDTSGETPRAAVYAGLPWSGIMLQQGTGRLWRYGTKSDVHASFLFSDSLPEKALMDKVTARLSSLNASVAGVDHNKVMDGLRGSDAAKDETSSYALGGETRLDPNEFKFVSRSNNYRNWKEIEIRDAASAKGGGVKTAKAAAEEGVPALMRLSDEQAPLAKSIRDAQEADGYTAGKKIIAVGESHDVEGETQRGTGRNYYRAAVFELHPDRNGVLRWKLSKNLGRVTKSLGSAYDTAIDNMPRGTTADDVPWVESEDVPAGFEQVAKPGMTDNGGSAALMSLLERYQWGSGSSEYDLGPMARRTPPPFSPANFPDLPKNALEALRDHEGDFNGWAAEMLRRYPDKTRELRDHLQAIWGDLHARATAKNIGPRGTVRTAAEQERLDRARRDSGNVSLFDETARNEPKSGPPSQGSLFRRGSGTARSTDRDGNALTLMKDGPAWITLSPESQATLHRIYGTAFDGVSVSAKGARDLIGKLQNKLSSTADAREARSIRTLVETLNRAVDADTGHGVVVSFREPNRSLTEAKKLVGEESFHGWQRFVVAGKPGLIDRGDAEALLAHPVAQRAIARLRQIGYPDRAVSDLMELSAKLASGQAADLGVTPDEAVNWLTEFFKAVEQHHGKNALAAIRRVGQDARKALDNAQRKALPPPGTEPSGDTARASVPSMEEGRPGSAPPGALSGVEPTSGVGSADTGATSIVSAALFRLTGDVADRPETGHAEDVVTKETGKRKKRGLLTERPLLSYVPGIHAVTEHAFEHVENVSRPLAAELRRTAAMPAAAAHEADAFLARAKEGLTPEQWWGVVLASDEHSRQFLAANFPDELAKYDTDPAIQRAANYLEPKIAEMTRKHKFLGGHALPGKYFPRSYPKEMFDQAERIGAVDNDDRRLGPRQADMRKRLATAKFFYENGERDASDVFRRKWINLSVHEAEQRAFAEFTQVAHAVRIGGGRPPFIELPDGSRYYSPDMIYNVAKFRGTGDEVEANLKKRLGVAELPHARTMKPYEEYRHLQRSNVLTMLAKRLNEAIETSPDAGVEVERIAKQAQQDAERASWVYLAPKDVVLAMKEVVKPDPIGEWLAAKGALKTIEALTRFARFNEIGLNLGIAHVMNLARSITHEHALGAIDPRGWLDAYRVLNPWSKLSGELKSQLALGPDDPLWRELMERAAVAPPGRIDFNFDAYLGRGWISQYSEAAFRRLGADPVRAQKYARWVDGGLNANAWLRFITDKTSGHLFKQGGAMQRMALFTAKSQFHGDTEEARWLAGIVNEEFPGAKADEVAKSVQVAAGLANRAGWTPLQRALGYFMLFPSWFFARARYFIDHPIRTSVPPAVLALVANNALYYYGMNSGRDRWDPTKIHIKGHQAIPMFWFEPIARHLMREPFNLLLEAAGETPPAPTEPWLSVFTGEAVQQSFPPIQAGALLYANRMGALNPRNIVQPADYKKPSNIMPGLSLATEKRILFAMGQAAPFAGNVMGDWNGYSVDSFLSITGGLFGVANYPDTQPAQRRHGRWSFGYKPPPGFAATGPQFPTE